MLRIREGFAPKWSGKDQWTLISGSHTTDQSRITAITRQEKQWRWRSHLWMPRIWLLKFSRTKRYSCVIFFLSFLFFVTSALLYCSVYSNPFLDPVNRMLSVRMWISLVFILAPAVITPGTRSPVSCAKDLQRVIEMVISNRVLWHSPTDFEDASRVLWPAVPPFGHVTLQNHLGSTMDTS